MTTLNSNTAGTNRHNVLVMRMESAKRLQWNRYRRYGF